MKEEQEMDEFPGRWMRPSRRWSSRAGRRIHAVVSFVLSLLVMAFLAGVVILSGGERPQGRRRPRSSRAGPGGGCPAGRARRTSGLKIVSQGVVESMREVMLSAEVGGRVVACAPNLLRGAAVGAGELLVEIEKEDYPRRSDAGRRRTRGARSCCWRRKRRGGSRRCATGRSSAGASRANWCCASRTSMRPRRGGIPRRRRWGGPSATSEPDRDHGALLRGGEPGVGGTRCGAGSREHGGARSTRPTIWRFAFRSRSRISGRWSGMLTARSVGEVTLTGDDRARSSSGPAWWCGSDGGSTARPCRRPSSCGSMRRRAIRPTCAGRRWGCSVEARIPGRVEQGVIEMPRKALRQGNRVLVADARSQMRERRVTVLRTLRPDCLGGQ